MAHLRRVAANRRRPNGAWEVRYRDTRNMTRRKIFDRKVDAERFRATVVVDKARGEFIDPFRASVLLADVAAAWRAGLTRDLKPKTVADYEWTLRRKVLPEFGRRKIGSITFADVDQFVVDLSASGQGARRVRAAYLTLKQVLDYAVRDGRIRVNPCAGVTLPKLPRREMLFLTAEQVAQLVAALPGQHGLIVLFAAYTGLRAGEIAALRVADVDWKAGVVRVTKSVSDVAGVLFEGEPKSAAGRRTVPLPRFLLNALRAFVDGRILHGSAYLFPGGRGGAWRQNNWVKAHFKPAVRHTLPRELHGLRFHDLRHTYASLLVEQGAHPKEMAELMGHSSVQITLDRYAHLMPHLGAALTERMDRAYARLQVRNDRDTIIVVS